MRRDLLRSIAEERDATNAIVLTHNIDFVFLQTVVLSALRQCGHPSLTVFADAGCAASAYAYQAPVLHSLGVRYRVVQIEMETGFRFHPKAVLLSGEEYAALYVGSGNLTFGGWSENAEVWQRFDTRTDGGGAFAAFFDYLFSVLNRAALPGPVRAEIDEAFDPKTRSWAAGLPEPGSLIGKVSGGLPILDQVMRSLGNAGVDRVTVCAPYFDDDGEALGKLAASVSPAPVTVLVQPGRTGLTERAWARLGEGPKLAAVNFRREDDLGHARDAFVHAKFYAFEHGNRVTVFLGSANCSRAALTIPGMSGNAELLSIQEMDAEVFRDFVGELVAEEREPGLAGEPVEAPEQADPVLRVLSASYEGSHLKVAYAPRSWNVSACQSDGEEVSFETIEAGLIGARVERPPRHVILTATDGNTPVRSAPRWVDHENELKSTARGRGVAEMIRSRVRAGEWGIGAWSEVLDIFCAHLRYLPPRSSWSRAGGPGRQHTEGGPPIYTAKDVFAVGYGLPSLSTLIRSLPESRDERVRSLQQLMLRWFGLRTLDDEGKDQDAAPRPAGDEDVVDVPEQLPKVVSGSRSPEPPTDRDRRRVEKLVAELCSAMTSTEFLDSRPPELLAADLRVAAVLLRVALREGWLDAAAFFQSTHRIWSALFFAGDGRDCCLERRYRSSASPEDFAAVMRSPDVLAALAAWLLTAPTGGASPEHARFALMAALAIARLPWLWDGVDDKEIGQELAELLANTGLGDGQSLKARAELDAIGKRWLEVVQRGHALRRLESVLVGQTPLEVRSRITELHLNAGDLLWQGAAGFCVVMNPAPRIAGTNVRVLRLQGRQYESDFRADLTIPMSALLDERAIPLSDALGPAPRRVLADFLSELAAGFRGSPIRGTPG